MDNKAVVLFSGGQDSTTCLAWARRQYGDENVYPIAFEYGQNHEVELACAQRVLAVLGCKHDLFTAKIEALHAIGGAELIAGGDSTYASDHGLPPTFVPGRNLVFLSLAAAYAARVGAFNIVTGVCEADEAGYPDCRRNFVVAAQTALTWALDDTRFRIHPPLLHLSKADTFALADELGVLDVVLTYSHTCYNGNRSTRHAWGFGCGKCASCQERKRGWEQFTTRGDL